MVQRRRLAAPAVEVAQEGRQLRPRAGGQLVAAHQIARRHRGGNALAARDGQHRLHRRIADTPARRVDDALKRQVVVLGLHQPEVGVGVADLGALEEARPADHGVGDLQQHEALLERPHLERGADQDRDVLVRTTLGPALDLLGHGAGFRLAVPHPAHLDLGAAERLGPQRLAQAVLVGRDQARRRREDVFRGPIVALQPHHVAPGKSRSKRRMLSTSAPRQP